MIADHLLPGKENAKPAKELAQLFGCNVREITERIEKERRQGQPICASCDPLRPGYYLAETAEDLKGYCKRLNRRAGEIHKTRRALLKTADTLPGGEQNQAAQ